MSGEPVNQVDGVARILAAGDPAAWRGLQAEHVADSTGHCRSCRPHSAGSPVWPCTLRVIGDHAEWLAGRADAARHRATGSGDRRRG